jgi:glycosyltransferase involved in cell wall biosynthesis
MTPLDLPRVSILLPVRDPQHYLEACLHSIRRQSLTDWECVVVDDGSGPEAREWLRRATTGDPRLTVVRTEPRGLVAALNTGLEHCRAPWVARMDHDDWMHRHRLRDQLRLLQDHPDWVGAGCHVRSFPRPGAGPGRIEYERWLNAIDSAETVRREAFVECPLAHPTWCIRREVLSSLGYRDPGWPEDYDLFLRLWRSDAVLGVLPRRRLGWRDHPARLTHTSSRYSIDRFRACKAHHLARSFLAAADRYILWGYGGTGRGLRRELERQGKLAARIVEVHPGRLGNRIHGAPVIPPESLPAVPALPIVVSVAGAEARTNIRRALSRMSYVELRDYICAA